MANELILLGPATSIVQNRVYSLPARLCYITALVAVEVSIDGSTWAALIDAETTGAVTGALFLRCTSGDTTVVAKDGTIVISGGGSGPTGYPALSGNAYDLLRGDGQFNTTIPRGTITASSPWTFSQTWNNAAVAFVGFLIAITKTAAALGSKYLNITNASGSAFAVIQTDATSVGLLANEGVATSQDFLISAASGGVTGVTRPDGAVGRIWAARHLLLGGAGPNAGAFPIGIFGDQRQGFHAASGRQYGWVASATEAQDVLDTAFSRSAAAVIEINNGTPGTLGDLVTRTIRGAAVAFASLPGTPVEGMIKAVTDSNTVVWGATIAGSGANHVLAYYNGTNWTVIGK